MINGIILPFTQKPIRACFAHTALYVLIFTCNTPAPDAQRTVHSSPQSASAPPCPLSLCLWVLVGAERASNGLWNVSKAAATPRANVSKPFWNNTSRPEPWQCKRREGIGEGRGGIPGFLLCVKEAISVSLIVVKLSSWLWWNGVIACWNGSDCTDGRKLSFPM